MLLPWLSLGLLGAILWLPGGWPRPWPAELLACMLLLAGCCWGRSALILLLPVACGLLQADRHLAERLPAELSGQDFLVRGQVCDFPRTGGRVSRFVLYLDSSVATSRLPARVTLNWYDSAQPPRAGETWQLKVRLREPRGFANPGAGDGELAAFLGRIGARGYVRPSSLNRRLAERGNHCPTLALRGQVLANIYAQLGEHPAAAHLAALTVGSRHLLTADDWDRLQRTGTAHLMAISGLHIGLLAGFCLLLGRGIGSGLACCGWQGNARMVGWLLAMACATGYAILAGLALPTQRALLMLFAWLAGQALARRISGWQILAISLWLILLLDGLAVLSAGFWLSFGAVLALLVAVTGCRCGSLQPPISRWLSGLVQSQWRVFLGLMPVVLLAFGQLSLVAPLANLVAIPLFAFAVMPLAFVGLCLSLLGVTAPLLHWAADLLGCVLWLLERLEIGAWSMPAVSPARLLCMLALIPPLIWPRPVPGRWAPVLILVGTLLAPPRMPAPGELRVTVMDVGQGLAVLVQTSGHSLLYDAGPSFGEADAGRYLVLPVLRAAGARRLDALVISHGDLDHAGGAASVYRAHPEASVLVPRSGSILRGSVACRAGQRWRWDGITFRFLHPRQVRARGPDNDTSCVLQVSGPGGSLLLPGDVGRESEARLDWRGQLRVVDLLLAPHHGSRTSSTSRFVHATRPRFVVVSAGAANRWGFPHADVVRRWHRAGACLLNTAAGGALVFESAAGHLQLRTRYRQAARRGWTLDGRGTEDCAEAQVRL